MWHDLKNDPGKTTDVFDQHPDEVVKLQAAAARPATNPNLPDVCSLIV